MSPERQKLVDELCSALTHLWGGGGESGVYTIMTQRERLEDVLAKLLDDEPGQKPTTKGR